MNGVGVYGLAISRLLDGRTRSLLTAGTCRTMARIVGTIPVHEDEGADGL